MRPTKKRPRLRGRFFMGAAVLQMKNSQISSA